MYSVVEIGAEIGAYPYDHMTKSCCIATNNLVEVSNITRRITVYADLSSSCFLPDDCLIPSKSRVSHRLFHTSFTSHHNLPDLLDRTDERI